MSYSVKVADHSWGIVKFAVGALRRVGEAFAQATLGASLRNALKLGSQSALLSLGFYKDITSQKYSQLPSLAKLDTTTEWFTANIPIWKWAFEVAKVDKTKPINCLEIGSWEGMSSVYILSELPNATLTCVDTWQGADELNLTEENINRTLGAESRFDSNTEPYSDRLVKRKTTSISYFAGLAREEVFDLIYIDGSHHSDDVIRDAISAFEHLAVGGLLFFDDYLWKAYVDRYNNPSAAINFFLKAKAKQIRVLYIGSQVVVVRVKTDNHQIRRDWA